MSGLINAFQFLTKIPVPKPSDASAPAAPWFPVVGLAIGLFLAAALWFGSRVDAWFGALFCLLVWVWVTGALHLDGLADMSDALGAAHRDRKKFLDVLADPHLGTFGVVSLFCQLAVKLVLLMLIAKEGNYGEIILVPAWARLGPLFWARLPSLKSGMGKHFSTGILSRGSWLWIALLIVFSLPSPALMFAPLAILVWREFLLRRIGGMTGDLLGAGIEVLESVLLLVLIGINRVA